MKPNNRITTSIGNWAIIMCRYLVFNELSIKVWIRRHDIRPRRENEIHFIDFRQLLKGPSEKAEMKARRLKEFAEHHQ